MHLTRLHGPLTFDGPVRWGGVHGGVVCTLHAALTTRVFSVGGTLGNVA